MPKNGKNSFWKFGDTPTVAYYSCNKGFSELNGDKVITCSYDSNEHRIKWKGNPLSCKGNLINFLLQIQIVIFLIGFSYKFWYKFKH